MFAVVPARAVVRRALFAASLFIALAPAIVTAQTRGRALTIEDYYKIKTIGGISLSPNTRWVAFTVGTRVEENQGNTSEVWLVGTDGAAPARRVSGEGVNASGIQWSPDGRLRFSGGGGSYLVDPANPAQVTRTADSSAGRGGAPGAGGRGGRGGGRGGRGGEGGGGGGGGGGASLTSPDGRMIAQVRNTPLPPKAPAALTEFEKRHEERFKGRQFDWMRFQRDGADYPVPNNADPYLSPPQEIFVTPAGGGEARQLTRLGLRPTGATWRHDGQAIIFGGDTTYRNELKYGADQIYSVSLDGTVRRLTTSNDHNHTGISLSPDRRTILFNKGVSTDAVIAKKMNNGGPRDLVVMPAEGGREINLTADWDYLPSGPDWSPDGKWIYFTGGIGGTTHLFRVAPTGGPVQQITTGERRINGIIFDSAMTMMVYTVGRMEAPSEIFTAKIDGSGEKQLTRVFDPFIAEVALSKSERLKFPSKDGTQIEGWLMYPYNYRANGGPYPLIVSSHGGPHSADGYSFDFKAQYFAANGYFVLKTNFRSSTGYGEKFLWATWGAWGDRDGEDVMAGVDYSIARYPIDRNRVATIGHSYGGFMSNWLITQYPDRFAAAAVGAGISNWISDYGTADIFVTKETEFYGKPWEEEARNRLIRQSPLTYAGRVKAATLFIHGEVDERVPYTEAEQMYFAIKRIGVPAKMIQYEGQAHGIGGSWNSVHRMLNELRWFDQYLKPTKAQ